MSKTTSKIHIVIDTTVTSSCAPCREVKKKRLLQLLIAVKIWLATLFVLSRILLGLFPGQIPPTVSSVILICLLGYFIVIGAFAMQSSGIRIGKNFRDLIRLGLKLGLLPAKAIKSPGNKKNIS